jgi:GNAT superfamily N-acetyltransferase
MNLIDGDVVIEEDPCAAFERITAAGYRLRYRLEQDHGSFAELIVQAIKGEAVVGQADFIDDGSHAHCRDVAVDSKHRRKGLATAIYVFAEKLFGRGLTDFWADSPMRSPDAAKLWSHPKRPFGAFRAAWIWAAVRLFAMTSPSWEAAILTHDYHVRWTTFRGACQCRTSRGRGSTVTCRAGCQQMR